MPVPGTASQTVPALGFAPGSRQNIAEPGDGRAPYLTGLCRRGEQGLQLLDDLIEREVGQAFLVTHDDYFIAGRPPNLLNGVTPKNEPGKSHRCRQVGNAGIMAHKGK
jgi:hypothetical protein